MSGQILYLVLLSSLFLNISCSLFQTKRSTVKDATVPKTQYNQLLKKYEKLLSEKRMESDSSPVQQIELRDQKNDSEKIESKKSTNLVESVDFLIDELYEDSTVRNTSVSKNQSSKKTLVLTNDRDINRKIDQLIKSKNFLDQGKYKDAMEGFKGLEFSRVNQIKSAANYYIAETLYRQQEYDLALQGFERVVKKFAFSGFVVQSLTRMIACSEKLNLKKEKVRYESILNDFLNYK